MNIEKGRHENEQKKRHWISVFERDREEKKETDEEESLQIVETRTINKGGTPEV